jgi:hypothetical protein
MCPSARTDVRPAAWKTMLGLVVVGLVLGVAGVGLVVATGSGDVRPLVDLSVPEAEAAYGACRDFARTRLDAPGPVTFAPLGRRTVRRYADGRVRVRSHADATNAAGRLVEVRVTCTMRPAGGHRWDLEGLALRSD